MLPNLKQPQQERCPNNHRLVDPMDRYRHCTNLPNLQKIDLVPYRFPSGHEFCYQARMQFNAHLGRQSDTDSADFSHPQPPPLLRAFVDLHLHLHLVCILQDLPARSAATCTVTSSPNQQLCHGNLLGDHLEMTADVPQQQIFEETCTPSFEHVKFEGATGTMHELPHRLALKHVVFGNSSHLHLHSACHDFRHFTPFRVRLLRSVASAALLDVQRFFLEIAGPHGKARVARPPP